jgi:hypothetical protein
MSASSRARAVSAAVLHLTSDDLTDTIDQLTTVSTRGLEEMYQPTGLTFPQTARGGDGRALQREGVNVRYTAIAALGLAQLPDVAQKQALSGSLAREILPAAIGLALAGRDPGAVALATWAAAEVTTQDDDSTAGDRDNAASSPAHEPTRIQRALDRLLATVHTGAPIPTVDQSWTLTALLAARHRADLDRDDESSPFIAVAEQLTEAAHTAAERLMAVQGPGGLFPHHLPPHHLSRLRSHIGCFADQVYPIQALARYAAAEGDQHALDAASRCTERICALQGDAGQWWWHYDSRGAGVVEGYPVYSVHQHAMAPMALMELHEAGGPDHGAEIALGLKWLTDHPESDSPLIDTATGVVWRKIGRRGPRKIVRKLRAAATAAHPNLHLTALDRMFPPGPVDYECRPYELGWLLYAWHSEGVVEALHAPHIARRHPQQAQNTIAGGQQ